MTETAKAALSQQAIQATVDAKVQEAERLLSIEAAIKGLGKSVDTLREELHNRAAAQADINDKISKMETTMLMFKGGWRMLLIVGAGLPFIAAVIYGLGRLVEKVSSS